MTHDDILMWALDGIPDIEPGDSLIEIILNALKKNNRQLARGDIFIIAQKIISKAEGRYVYLPNIVPSTKATVLARCVNKDPRKVQVIINESRRIIRVAPPRSGHGEGVIITEHRLGFISANAAVDASNINQLDSVLLLPEDPDESARKLRSDLRERLGLDIGVIISDTFGRPWRRGQINVAIGIAGVPALTDLIGSRDAYGNLLNATMPALADEIAAASGLLMKKSLKRPVIVFHGTGRCIDRDSSAQELLRAAQEDLFR